MTATATTTAPAATAEDEAFNVWVGCLACYNAGRLVGEWAPAAEAPTNEAEFAALVGASKLRRAGHYSEMFPHEELWVFDHENSPVDGEYSPSAAREYAEAMGDMSAEEQAALRDWLENDRTNELTAEGVEQFRESYQGTYDRAEDWVRELHEESELPAWAEAHRGRVIEGITNDMRLGGEFWTTNAPGLQVRVFESR